MADRLAEECGLVSQMPHRGTFDEMNIELRQEIRRAIQQGQVGTACEQINELCPTLFDDQPLLHLHLLVDSAFLLKVALDFFL